MSKHRHEPDTSQPSDQTRRASSSGDEDNLPNRTANTSLTNPGPPPTGGGTAGRQGAARGTAGGDQDNLPNRTANTSLTNPGPPPASAEASEMSQSGGATPARGYTGPSSGNVPNSDDMIPWDSTGKIDDEVERRYRNPPSGATTPPGSTLPRDAGSGSSGDYSGPITSGPADTGASGVRTLEDVRPGQAPAQGTHRGADSGSSQEKPYAGPHRDPGGYGEVQ